MQDKKLQTLLIERDGKVVLIRLHRPDALNALNDQLMDELRGVLDDLERDDSVSVAVLTGSEKSFAAGADISAMQPWSYMDVYKTDYVTRNWERLASFRKPVIAAVAGYALGGGCEVAMMCDVIIAAENARFGQPEIRIGVIPGAGGTQRLARAIGKSTAMEMCLTGRMMDAGEALRTGLVSRVVPTPELVSAAMEMAHQIAGFSLPAAMMVKEAVNRSFEGGLREGLLFERRVFHAMFSMHDQKEGMAAFISKRKPEFLDH